MTFSIGKFDQKVPLSDTSKKNHLVILIKSFLTWLIWLVVFLISRVVDYLIGQINQQKIWAIMFLGQFLIKKIYILIF